MSSEVSQKIQIRLVLSVACLLLVAFATLLRPVLFEQRVSAKPAYMDRYNRDPYAKTELIDKCTVCHVGRGGAERNEFGEAFEYAGYRITPKLRAKFPKLFDKEPRKEP